MKFLHLELRYFKIIFFIYFLFEPRLQAVGSWNFCDKFQLKCSGTVVEELIATKNLNVLNACIAEDSVGYILTTIDYCFRADCGDIKIPRLSFYTDLRFRYAWGSAVDTKTLDSSRLFVDSIKTITGSSFNKHLLWMREGWMKMVFGSDPENHQHFVQVGLIPFQIGRGLSLGDAYDVLGFLGFTAGFGIDQYAPAVLLSANPCGKNILNAYVALIDSRQSSLDENFEIIRSSEIGSCKYRGVSHKSFIFALNSKIYFDNTEKHQKTIIEPYLMNVYVPDKNLEFTNDIDANLSTLGLCVEVEYKKMNWGFECARNLGDAFVKPWDRNRIEIVKQSNGQVAEKYSKIYDKSPLDSTAELVYVTDVNQAYVNSSEKNVSENGKQIGPNLFNALSRFRPEQTLILGGFFFVGDVAYDYIPKVLKGGIGVGYFSGFGNTCLDLNHVSSEANSHQSFTGFIPVQSQYVGKRIKHLVMFNQGIARYTIATSPPTIDTQNITPSINTDSIDSTTNISFIGTRLAWNVKKFAEHQLLLAPNVIGYWSPETPRLIIPATATTPAIEINVANYLGTELNLEFSVEVIKNLKFSGYAGMLIPGSYYKSIQGTIVKKFNLPIGDNIAWICDMAFSYTF